MSRTQYLRARSVAWRRVGGQAVLVNLDRRTILGLNATGSEVWVSLPDEAGGTGAAPPVRVAQPAEETAETDPVTRFLADLAEEGMLVRAGVAGAGAPPALPSPGAVAPAVAWRDGLQAFGGACGFLVDELPSCPGNNMSS